MKKWDFQFVQPIALLAASALLTAPRLFAADEATPLPASPAQPAAPGANAPAGGRGNRAQGDNPQRGNIQGGRGNMGGGRNFNFGGLNLDEKQNELLREAMRADSDELRKLAEKLQAAQKELVKTIVAEKYDEKIVREKAEAVTKIQTEITVLRAKSLATVSPTLKPEQREQIENSRAAVGFITGTAIGFGGAGPQEGMRPQDRADRSDRRINNNNGGDPNQSRRRGNGPGAPGQ